MAGDRDDEGLFELAPAAGAEGIPAGVKPPVDKTFRAFDPDQGFLLPPSLDEWLPADHLARFIADLVDEHLDLSRIHAAYTETRGGPPYDPRLMVRLLLYGYCTGVRSSRKIERACTDVVAFRWLAAGAGPDYRAIARFRARHLSALGHLFTQALALCQAAGMVRLGQVALDGTKVRANASRRKAMSYARMTTREKALAEEVSAMLFDAEAVDKAEDAAHGRGGRDDDLPPDLRRKTDRLAKIRQAKAALEAEAAAAAAEHAAEAARRKGADEQEVAERAATAAEKAVPKAKTQRNFTDPDSRIMKTSDGSFHQCYNAQAVVDADHQVIVATDLGQCAADVANLISMTEQATANTGTAPGQVLADAGYCSDVNLEQAAEMSEQTGTEFFIATGRTSHDEPVPPARPADGSPPARPAGNGWPASYGPNPGGPPTPAARPSWNPCSGRCTLCRTLNSYSCAAWTPPAANGCSWPPATTCASSTATSASTASPASPPAEHPLNGPSPAHSAAPQHPLTAAAPQTESPTTASSHQPGITAVQATQHRPHRTGYRPTLLGGVSAHRSEPDSGMWGCSGQRCRRTAWVGWDVQVSQSARLRRMISRGILEASASVVPMISKPALSNIDRVPTNAIVVSIRPCGSTG